MSNAPRRKHQAHADRSVRDRLSELPGESSLPRPWIDDSPDLSGGRSLSLMMMTQGAYRRIVSELDSLPPEAAGVLLGPADNEPLVTHFVLDTEGVATTISFAIDAEFLNRVLAQYRACHLTCVGIAHSHPIGVAAPSIGDREYLAELFRVTGTQQPFLFPVYCDGQLHPYLALPGQPLPTIVPAALVLV